jgi:hypothetical protein
MSGSKGEKDITENETVKEEIDSTMNDLNDRSNKTKVNKMVDSEVSDVESQQKEEIEQLFADPVMRAEFNKNAQKVIETNMKKLKLEVPSKNNLGGLIEGIATTSTRMTQAVQMARIEKEVNKQLKGEIKKEITKTVKVEAKTIQKMAKKEAAIEIKKVQKELAKTESELKKLAEEEENTKFAVKYFYVYIALIIIVSAAMGLLYWTAQ